MDYNNGRVLKSGQLGSSLGICAQEQACLRERQAANHDLISLSEARGNVPHQHVPRLGDSGNESHRRLAPKLFDKPLGQRAHCLEGSGFGGAQQYFELIHKYQ